MGIFIAIVVLVVFLTFLSSAIISLVYLMVAGLSPVVSLVLVAVVFAITYFLGRLALVYWKKYLDYSVGVLFAGGFISYIFFNFFVLLLYKNSWLQRRTPDAFVYGLYDYSDVIILAVFLFYAIIYYCINKFSKKQLNFILSNLHFWLSFISLTYLSLAMKFTQLAVRVRLYYDKGNLTRYQPKDDYNLLSSSMMYLLLAAQILFFCNCIYSFIRKKNGLKNTIIIK